MRVAGRRIGHIDGLSESRGIILTQAQTRNVDALDHDLRRFACRVAGPRDFVINLIINGTIAWFVFGSAPEIPVAGPDSLFKMLIPMATIESTLTSFFGVMNGVNELRKKAASPSMSNTTLSVRSWIAKAIRYSLLRGALGFAGALTAKFAVGGMLPESKLAPLVVVGIIGLTSGLLAYVLHSRAVIHSAKLITRNMAAS